MPRVSVLAICMDQTVHDTVSQVHKNSFVFTRSTLALLGAPTPFVFLLLLLKIGVKSEYSIDVATKSEAYIEPCRVFSVDGFLTSRPCITLAYTPIDSSTTAMMQSLAGSSGLTLGEDIVGVSSEAQLVQDLWYVR